MKGMNIEARIATIQIEKELCGKPCDICKMNHENCMPHRMAKKLAAKGWRNAFEVVNDIFEEIHMELQMALDSNYRARQQCLMEQRDKVDDLLSVINGKIAALRGVDEYLEHIKKKYKVE